MTTTDLHQRIATDAAGAVSELRRYEGVDFSWDGPTWSDAAGVIVETVRDHPTDGFAFLDATGGDTPDIVGSVISGWSMATVDAAMAEDILERLARLDLTAVADDISGLLANVGRGDTQPDRLASFPRRKDARRQFVERNRNSATRRRGRRLAESCDQQHGRSHSRVLGECNCGGLARRR
jgi:hypothetical protein